MKKVILAAAMILMSTAAFAQKFAHVNSQEVFQLMPEMDKVRADLDAIVKENQDIIKSMYDEFQSKYQTYQQKVSTWSESIRQSKEKELGDLQQRIQETEQSVQQEIQQIQQKLTAPVMQKCNEAIAKVAKELGCVYVFDVNTVLYFDPEQSVDITPILRKELNIPAERTLEALQKELQAKAALE